MTELKSQELECRLVMARLELEWVKDGCWWWGTVERVEHHINRWARQSVRAN